MRFHPLGRHWLLVDTGSCADELDTWVFRTWLEIAISAGPESRPRSIDLIGIHTLFADPIYRATLRTTVGVRGPMLVDLAELANPDASIPFGSAIDAYLLVDRLEAGKHALLLLHYVGTPPDDPDDDECLGERSGVFAGKVPPQGART